MTDFLNDVRYALRMLAKNPGFTAVAVLTLTLGIGANTAVFSVLNGVLLRPLPFRQPSRLMVLSETSPQFKRMSVAYFNLLDWKAQSRSFETVSGFRYHGASLTGSGDPERLAGRSVSAGLFASLGVAPLMGREFTPQEDRLGAAPVAMIGEGLWRRRFGGDPGILGRALVLSGKPHVVVGIVPASFHFPIYEGEDEIWTPLGQRNDPAMRTRESHPGIRAIARLKDGVTVDQAREDMNLIASHLAAEYPATNRNHGVSVLPMKTFVVGDAAQTLWVLLTAVAFVLLIACVNVANLQLARSSVRRTEIAIRAALGAGRSRIVRQLLTESIVLALIAGALGLVVAAWTTGAMVRWLPLGLPRTSEIRLDGGVLLFTILASIVTGIVFGTIPALQTAAVSPLATLKETGRGAIGGRHRLRDALVVAEIALALTLLTGAGLMVRTMIHLNQANPGLDLSNVLMFSVSLPSRGPDAPVMRESFHQLLQRIGGVPGIESVAINSNVPLSGNDDEEALSVVGRPRPRTQADMIWANFYPVSPGYLKVMKIPLLRGRFFDEHDDASGRNVVVIDETMARTVFPGQDPLGKQIRVEMLDVDQPREIIGVVGHVKHYGLGSEEGTIRNAFYMPFVQIPDRFVSLFGDGISFVARTTTNPFALVEAVKAQVIGADRNQPVFDVRSMEQNASHSLARQRFSMMLLAIFAALALVLACVGIYGLAAYTVSQQTHEIGIRMALGASAADVLKGVVGRAAVLAAAGVGLGLVLAFAATRTMAALLYETSPNDAVTFTAVALVLAACALLASYAPARRAASIDPLSALRYE